MRATQKSTQKSTHTSVYRYFDRDGLLLYVGITKRNMLRQREHNASKAWWPFVSSQDVEHYSTRGEAEQREKTLIKAFRPPFNTTHNVRSDETRAAYLASIESSTTGIVQKKITLDRTGDHDGLVWFTSTLDQAATVSKIDMSHQAWDGPRKSGKVRDVWRTGALLAVQVEERAEIEAVQVILRYESQNPVVLQIKKITPLLASG